MKKIFIFVISCIAAMTVSTSCKMAPSDNPGDTVAASVFEPIEAGSHVAKSKNDTTNIKNSKDSTDIFFVGEGSTKHNLQLVSYPSKKDTATYYKGKHLNVTETLILVMLSELVSTVYLAVILSLLLLPK